MNRHMGPALAVIFALTPVTASAESVSFEEALELAGNSAPSLKGPTVQIDAAQSAAISADRLPDPTIDVGIKDFPVTGPDAGRLNRDNFTMTTVGISQQFPNPAKRRARAGRASADIGIAEAELAREVRIVRLNAGLAWIDVYYGQRRLAALDLLEASLADLQATAKARLTSGSTRPSQTLEPEVLRAEVDDRRSILRAEIAKAKARLAYFTGGVGDDVEGPAPQLEIDEDALLSSIAQLPDLQLMDAQIGVAEAETRLARADKNPDWKVSASYGRREPAFGDLVTVGVSIDLPLFSKRRQDPKIAARALEADRARYDRRAAELKLIATLQGEIAEHRAHHQRLVNARDRLVPLARQQARLDVASYGAGTIDLGSVLMSAVAATEAEVDAVDREVEVARDAVRLNITYGEDRP